METYKCNATTDVHSCATMVFKVKLFGKRVVKVVEHDVANGVDGGPEDNGHTEPAVQGQDLGVGKAKGVQHRPTQNKEQDQPAGSNGSVAAANTDDH